MNLKKHKPILQSSFYQLLAIYSIAIILSALGLFSQYVLHFEIAAVIIALLGIAVILNDREEGQGKVDKRLHIALLVLGIILIIFFRSVYYVNYDIPLGYDAGLYKYGIEHGLENQDRWILNGGMEPGFLYFMKPLSLIFSTHFLLTAGFVFFTLLLGIAVYVSTRTYFGKKAGLVAFLLYSVSTAQYLVFTYMYYKNIIALALMLFAISCLRNKGTKSRIVFILLGALVGAIHRPTFFIFGLSYFVYAFVSPINHNGKGYSFGKLKSNLLGGIAIVVVTSLFYIGKFWPAIASMFSPVLGSLANPGESPGTFISFTSYQFITLSYLILALMGLIYCVRNKDLNMILIWAVINGIIVYFQFFFFNRFIIHLDIAFIILAGLGAAIIMDHRPKLGTALVALLILTAGALTWHSALDTRPVISQENFDAIKSILELTPSDSYVMSVSREYSPWILAYSERRTIAPGLFDYDLWSEDQWEEFWGSQDKGETKELMRVYETYGEEIYLFAGSKNFTNPCFIPIGDLLKYDC